MSTSPPIPHREHLARHYLRKEGDALDEEERVVITAIDERMPVSRDADDLDAVRSTLGDRMADRVAAIGGSWSFILLFTVVLLGWMVLNSDVLPRWKHAFDPYPYIFLNLMLSTLAAVQAPIIMMSQNRQAAKDRVAAAQDYTVNLHAELEIMRLHDKLDALRADHAMLMRMVAEKPAA